MSCPVCGQFQSRLEDSFRMTGKFESVTPKHVKVVDRMVKIASLTTIAAVV
jgi:hypothetical protein